MSYSSVAVNVSIDALRLSGTVIRLVRHLNLRMSQAMSDDLALADVMVLGAIDRGTVIAAQIARSQQLDPPRVTRIVDRLVTVGYVRRGEDPTDRRRSPLALTASGKQRLDRARSALSQAMTEIVQRLPDGEQDRLIDSLERVRSILEE